MHNVAPFDLLNLAHFQFDSWVWVVAGIVVIIAVDLFIQARSDKEPSLRSAGIQMGVYVSLAILFGIHIARDYGIDGPELSKQFFAGYITELSLSVDNLFVFMVILANFKVPRKLQSQALLVGIAIALVLRAIFIAVGAAAIEAFSWVFFIFGAFLLWTAWGIIKDAIKPDAEDEAPGGKLMEFMRKRFNTVDEFHGHKLTVKIEGRRFITPLMMVMVAIGFTDLLFALDSIPAVYGLTNEAFIVVTANAFALLGLRQLYFLLAGLMERLKYLGFGLSVILAWIGVKLILHALHENELPFINGGKPVKEAPEISIELSLSVILITLVVTIVVSLLSTARDKRKESEHN
jgi:tellurite resistance protein TerC